MKRLLILSPHWAPVNAPDMQRVRMALPYFRENGWEPTVLCIRPDLIEGAVLDPLLEHTYPADIRVIRSAGLPAKFTRWAGLGNLWLRCGAQFRRAGDELLRRERFDLAFFSTTQFSSFRLGPRWLRQHGLPYVLDYQDPWRNTYYADNGVTPPGGWLKYEAGQLEARLHERRTLRDAAGLIAVSDTYGHMLSRLHPGFDAGRVRVLPFGASESDFALARTHRPASPLVDFNDGFIHLVYVGRSGPDMRFAMTALFTAFRAFLASTPARAERLRFHFIGTDYAPPPQGREWAMPIARELGIESYVSEYCRRVPYFDALHYLAGAQAVLAIGSDDPTYSASKLYPCILARKPLLLLFHQDSLVNTLARRLHAGTCLTFKHPTDLEELAESIHKGWFQTGAYEHHTPHDEEAFAPLTSKASTAGLCAHFDSLLSPRPITPASP